MDSADHVAAVSAVVNVLAALGVLYVMQSVTADAGFSSRLALVKFGHRISLAILSITLAVNAGATLTAWERPRLIDVMVQVAFLVVIAFSAVRHAMAPPPRD